MQRVQGGVEEDRMEFEVVKVQEESQLETSFYWGRNRPSKHRCRATRLVLDQTEFSGKCGAKTQIILCQEHVINHLTIEMPRFLNLS